MRYGQQSYVSTIQLSRFPRIKVLDNSLQNLSVVPEAYSIKYWRKEMIIEQMFFKSPRVFRHVSNYAIDKRQVALSSPSLNIVYDAIALFNNVKT